MTGKALSIVLRSVHFSGSDFDSLEPELGTPKNVLSNFTLSPDAHLWGCVFDIEMEVPVFVAGEEKVGVLAVHLGLGMPYPSVLRIALRIDGSEYSSEETEAFFEDALQSLQLRLPESVRLKICFSCGYSDYHPIGHGTFGGMGCFRNAKADYSQVRNKKDLLRLWKEPEFVQETFVCQEFRPREPNTGYRG
jgi:hypothetical protein